MDKKAIISLLEQLSDHAEKIRFLCETLDDHAEDLRKIPEARGYGDNLCLLSSMICDYCCPDMESINAAIDSLTHEGND